MADIPYTHLLVRPDRAQFSPQQGAEIAARIAEDNGYLHAEAVSDEEYLVVHRLMFHWTLMRGLLWLPEVVEERWCYRDLHGPQGVMTALEEWRARGWQGEPTGWHRHPSTARRRKDGDPAQEYIDG